MANADDVVYITEDELKQLIGQDAGGIGKAKERVVGKDCSQAHGPGMEQALVAETAQTAMAVDNLDLLPQHNVAEDGKEGEDGGEGGVTVYDGKGDVVDLDAVGEVPDALSVVVGMGHDNDLVAAVDEL